VIVTSERDLAPVLEMRMNYLLPSHHEAYCDLRLYQQQRFMGTQILDLRSHEALLRGRAKQQRSES
jgi:hypothetical protein